MEEKHVRTPLASLIPSFRAHPPSPSPSAIPHCFLPRWLGTRARACGCLEARPAYNGIPYPRAVHFNTGALTENHPRPHSLGSR